LCKPQMMIIAELASADEAGLLGHKPHLLAIAYAPGARDVVVNVAIRSFRSHVRWAIE
jgi:hypothetical protein